jgi:Sensors of blue-light using FAD
MATTHLARIAYVSSTHTEIAHGELQTQMSAWRRGNAGRGVTGFLLYHRASVFQLLEGFPDVIQLMYDTIARDERQRLVAKLVDESIDQRSFGDWSMGHARIVRTELGAVPSLRPFLDPEFRYWQCDEGMGRTLISAFTTGPWRRAIS